MLSDLRRAQILADAREQGGVSLRELSHRFDVSIPTIRRDLSALADQGLVRRVHGGAVALRTDRSAPRHHTFPGFDAGPDPRPQRAPGSGRRLDPNLNPDSSRRLDPNPNLSSRRRSDPGAGRQLDPDAGRSFGSSRDLDAAGRSSRDPDAGRRSNASPDAGRRLGSDIRRRLDPDPGSGRRLGSDAGRGFGFRAGRGSRSTDGAVMDSSTVDGAPAGGVALDGAASDGSAADGAAAAMRAMPPRGYDTSGAVDGDVYVARPVVSVAEAAALVKPGMAVGISGGWAAVRVAGLLDDVRDLTVVTPMAAVAAAVANQATVVVLVGGIRTPSGSHAGPLTRATLASLNLDLVVVELRDAATTGDALAAQTDLALVQRATAAVFLDATATRPRSG